MTKNSSSLSQFCELPKNKFEIIFKFLILFSTIFQDFLFSSPVLVYYEQNK